MIVEVTYINTLEITGKVKYQTNDYFIFYQVLNGRLSEMIWREDMMPIW